MPPRKQEPPVHSDAAEKTDVNVKLLEEAEAASAETVTAERQQPGTRRKRGTKATTDAQPTETSDAAAKPRTSRRKSTEGVQPVEPQPKEAPEAASLAEEAALTVAPAAEPAGESASSAATAEVDTAATDTAEEAAPVLQLLETPLKKKERSETHDKDRVFIRKDLKLRLDALAENRSKGFKTLLLNYGLEKALDELEQAEAARQEN
ncbi:hypothetical protein SAMN04487970_104835 [Paenibacillus tianmuensis]|uniref:Uncharacterized protein n=1 Tax=Paenibacillus tianmuensis TaxID=624147 RepID=A0A1G4TCZ8_9BACL|nr:hypothetical protein [Paenibacillus tianmuensis]SCW79221.1 hypothetical protein SAMN04487970_104835 [Paenibacillus tianmuensis]